MGYVLAIDVGDEVTRWARRPGPGEPAEEAAGQIASEVVVSSEGVVVASDGGQGSSATSGFVALLGSSDTVMVGGTPYGCEALVGALLRSIVDRDRAETGADPSAIVVLHDPSFDEFRASLLAESARLAGIGAITTVQRRVDGDPGSTAAATAGGLAPVSGPTVSTALAAGGAATAAAGGAAVIAAGGSDAIAATTAAAAGSPLGVAGPGGASLGAAGPQGASLASGPAGGAPIGPAGGAPIGPAGGAPIGPAGGAPIEGAAGVAAKAGLPGWFPIAAVAGIVAVAVGVGVAVVATRDDSTASSPPATQQIVTDPTTGTAEGETDPTTGAVDTAPVVVPSVESTVAETTVTTEPDDVFGPFAVDQVLGDTRVTGVVCDLRQPFTFDIEILVDVVGSGVATMTPDEPDAGGYRLDYQIEGGTMWWTGEYTIEGIGTDEPRLVVAAAGEGQMTAEGFTIDLPDDPTDIEELPLQPAGDADC